MRRIIIDIGTNSTLFLSGELDKDQKIKNIMQRFHVTRLGEGVHQTGMISNKAMERTIDILAGYAEEVTHLGIPQVHVLGTQALRIAKNAIEFKRLVKKKFNWDLEILSEEQEAKYSYIGACDAVNTKKQKVVVMDMGGGSTEVIVGEENRIISYQSLPIGAVNLAEKSAMKEILTEEDKKDLFKLLVSFFRNLIFFNNISNTMLLIGVGGTITTLAAIEKKLIEYNSGKINGLVLTKNTITAIFNHLNKLTMEDRRKIPGLVKGREDVILYGAYTFLTFMELFNINRIIVSDRGLRFGYLKWIEMDR